MKVLIMTNGEYGNLEWYQERKEGFDQIICVDGGAGWARNWVFYQIGLWEIWTPSVVMT